jgi:hypothetical protein
MISIVKRNGSTEPLSEEKYNRVVMWESKTFATLARLLSLWALLPAFSTE